MQFPRLNQLRRHVRRQRLFADRLRELAEDILVIELAVNGAINRSRSDSQTDLENRDAIMVACRKLKAEIDELADQVLPPMSDEDKAVIAAAMKAGRS